MLRDRAYRALIIASALLASACVNSITAPTERQTFRLEVTNPYPKPMNVTVDHIGGVWILGAVPAQKSREFEIRMVQAQSVFVVATPLDGPELLRQAVYLSPACVTRIVLQNTPTAAPIAVTPAPGTYRKSSGPECIV